jgi:CDP-6-deoxy-D-xylo-4-hexulose-3-dehydrase
MKKIDLVEDTINTDDIDQLIEWLKTYPRLTKGPMTWQFEEAWSHWLGCKYSVFVNSGSSANLLMLNCLQVTGLLRNNYVCVPALCWATDLAPVMQLGLEPVLVDCNLENLSVDLTHLEQIFITLQPSTLLLVSVLGFAPNMDRITELCDKYDVILLEDNCESQGTKYKGIRLGNFGLMSSFSTYFGHTMSTIEGGMICTNNEHIYHTLLQLRSHGWDRDLPEHKQLQLRQAWAVDDFSSLYTFYVPGFNLRGTDVQAFLGINQLKKVDDMIQRRFENFLYFKSALKGKVWFPQDFEDSYTSNFAIPLIMNTVQDKERLIEALRRNNIVCRPLISGSMGIQPFYITRYSKRSLTNCTIIDERGLYVPNHDKLSREDIDLICNTILTTVQ